MHVTDRFKEDTYWECNIGNNISWSAIFAGVVIGLVISTLLNLLGLGLGFSAFTVDADTIKNIGMGSILWLLISSAFSMLAGGWVAGRFSIRTGAEGVVHGLITWGLATLLTFALMISGIGALISGTANVAGHSALLIGQAAAVTGKGAIALAPQANDLVKNILPDINSIVNPPTPATPQGPQPLNSDQAKALTQQLSIAVAEWFSADTEINKTAARQKVIQILTQQANLTSEQAEQSVSAWEQKYQTLKTQFIQKAAQAKQQAIEDAEKTSRVLATITLITFFIFLGSGLAAAIGGGMGANFGCRKNHVEPSVPMDRKL